MYQHKKHLTETLWYTLADQRDLRTVKLDKTMRIIAVMGVKTKEITPV